MEVFIINATIILQILFFDYVIILFLMFSGIILKDLYNNVVVW